MQLTSTGAVIVGPDAALAHAQRCFAQDHMVQLPRFLDPELLALADRALAEATFVPKIHAGIARESCMTANPMLSLLHFALNDTQLYRGVERVTGCAAIGCFTARVFRLTPDSDDYDSWHSDATSHRLIGLTVNLTDRPYQGGILQLRDTRSGRICAEVANVVPGDAVLFRIAEWLTHRVTPVTGTVPRVTFAGWFHSEPDFAALLANPEAFDL
jgi:hypothetical protein